jgi:hypothetical protein
MKNYLLSLVITFFALPGIAYITMPERFDELLALWFVSAILVGMVALFNSRES